MKSLSDEELGILVRSLIRYSADGERTDLPEKLTLAFDFIAEDIDTGHAKAKELSAKRTKAVEQRWHPVQVNTNDTNVDFVSHTKTNTKTNTKTKTNTNTKSRDYGSQNFDQKVVRMSEIGNYIE